MEHMSDVSDRTPIRIHPDNPKLFEFRGKPLVLLTATEHYGAVINRPFRFERYLEDAAAKRITLTRLFTLFREQQSPVNPASTCKPESPDFVAPYLRTGPGRGRDQELRYDLDQPNPEYYERLHAFLSLASELGVVVEVVLLSNTYGDRVWELNPLHADNNVNGMPHIAWPEYMSVRHEDLYRRQVDHVRRVTEEVTRYDNVIIEICNEPGGYRLGGEAQPSMSETNAWLDALIGEVRAVEKRLGRSHLVAGQECFAEQPFVQPLDRTVGEMDYEVANVHPLHATLLRGRLYQLGAFMSKQLCLREYRDFCLAAYQERKPVNLDEDNVASQYRDRDGWIIHRKRAWVAALCGAHYDYIDFSIQPWLEQGTDASQEAIRSWFGHLSGFVHDLDLVAARPLPEVVAAAPDHTVAVAFGVVDADSTDLAVYIADARELSAARDLFAEPVAGAGEPLQGEVLLSLPAGEYSARWYDPETGHYREAAPVSRSGSEPAPIAVPDLVHDRVLRIRATAE